MVEWLDKLKCLAKQILKTVKMTGGREEAFLGEQNPFWKQTLSSWKKLLKNTGSGIQDRTIGTKYKEIN